MYKNLKIFRESLHMTQKDFAASLGIGQTTYNGYETGARDPKSDFWIAVARKYGVTVDYLMGFSNDPHKTSDQTKKAPSLSDEALDVASKYVSLDRHGKEMVDVVIEKETARMELEAKEAKKAKPRAEKPKTKIIPLFGNSFAAGAPEPDFGNPWEDYEVPYGTKADFAIHINGDSMEPYLPDGSIALGRRGQPADGGVGAFLLDGEFLCKQYCQDFLGNIYLFSLNRKRKDADVTVWHDSGRALTCFGTILMDKRVGLPRD